MLPIDPNTAVSTLYKLYSSGAFLCMGIVAVYLALKLLATRVAWLEVPNRAHYVTAVIGVLALFAAPAAAGTAPSLAMIMTAFPAIIALVMPGIVPVAPSDPTLPVAKVVKVGAVLALAMIVSCATLKTMSGAWATCAGDDLGQIVATDGSNGITLAQDVERLIESNGANLEGDLLALAGKVTLDAVECVVTAYEQEHSSGSAGSAVIASAALSPAQLGLARAKAFIAAQRKAAK